MHWEMFVHGRVSMQACVRPGMGVKLTRCEIHVSRVLCLLCRPAALFSAVGART